MALNPASSHVRAGATILLEPAALPWNVAAGLGLRDFKDIEANYLDERSSRWMYSSLAPLDKDRERAAMLGELADYEEKHAGLWEALLRDMDRSVPPERRLLDHRLLVAAARVFGVGVVLPLLHKSEVDGIAKYKLQAERWRDTAAHATVRDILPDEVAHEVDTFQAMRTAGPRGSTVRSIILGANDGLGSILALAAGVASATGSSGTVLIAGVAGLVAGAASMAGSNFVSVRAETELYRSQARLERDALAVAPETKRAQLAAAFQARGFTGKEAEAAAERLVADSEAAVRALLAERHGMATEAGPSPGRLAGYTGVAFALAGLVPLLPFLFLPALPGTLASVALSGTALFVAGVLRALATLTPFLRSGIEMLLVGMGAAAATFAAGAAVGSLLA